LAADAGVRLVTWNCCMALHRKFDALLRLRPDVAVICECAEPQRLAAFGGGLAGCNLAPVWIGDNRNKGLAVFTCNGYRAQLSHPFYPTLRHVAICLRFGPRTQAQA
jgi:exodeoxyribonuclease III